MLKKLLFLFVFLLLVTNITAQKENDLLEVHFNDLINKGKLSVNDAKWKLTSEHVSSISNIHHIYFSQLFNGITVANTESSIHVLSGGKVITNKNRFVKNISSKSSGSPNPNISVFEAIVFVSKYYNETISKSIEVLSSSNDASNKITLTNGGFAEGNIKAELKYILDNNSKIILSWEITFQEKNHEHWWNVYVDSNSGLILSNIDNMFSCTPFENVRLNQLKTNHKIVNTEYNLGCENCYEVFSYPIESPYFGERSIVVDPANSNASPYGWHDRDGEIGAEYFDTRGNNIDAFTDVSSIRVNGGNLLNFTNYSFGQDYNQENKYIEASISNVFYWGNIMHDVMYTYGFNEEAGNFQYNNYGKGGVDNDFVKISGQVEDFCNAQIGIGPEGSSSHIFMGTCGNKDADFDNLVLLHEYAHGISYRLVGGAFSFNCFNGPYQMSEGISDWYGLIFTMSDNNVGSDARGYATYLFNQGPNGGGVRDYPYSTDLEINPIMYHQNSNDTSYPGLFWGSVLWDLTWELIDNYGFNQNINDFTGNASQDAGNIIALAIITESLKLVNCNPNLIDTRDAIFEANRAIYGEDAECLLWNAFAKRGLGPYATIDGDPSFETISPIASLNARPSIFCELGTEYNEVTGGEPIGGVYSGIGVTDNGDGKTFTFDANLVGAGNYTIKYEVPDSFCSIASFSESEVTVVLDEANPTLNCMQSETIVLDEFENNHTIVDYSELVYFFDNCSTPDFAQDPIPGTLVGIGDIEINITSTDASGNQSNCSFILTVEKNLDDNDIFNIYPNPTNGNITITSNKKIEYLALSVIDINGRYVYTKEYREFNFEKNISIEKLASGNYFLKLETKDNSIIKRLLKN